MFNSIVLHDFKVEDFQTNIRCMAEERRPGTMKIKIFFKKIYFNGSKMYLFKGRIF